MRKQNVSVENHPSLWRFFTLAFVLSWLFWVPAAIMSQSKGFVPPGILFFLGGFGPSVAGVFLIYRTRDKAGQIDFWRRVFSFRRIGIGWYAFICLVFPLLAALSVLAELLAGRSVPFFPYLVALAAEPLLVFLCILFLRACMCPERSWFS